MAQIVITITDVQTGDPPNDTFTINVDSSESINVHGKPNTPAMEIALAIIGSLQELGQNDDVLEATAEVTSQTTGETRSFDLKDRKTWL